MFTEFFEKPDVSVLVLTLNVAGMIVPCLGFPESLKSKGVYFIKTKPETINKENYKTRLLYGDISPAPVDQLIAVVEEVRVTEVARASCGSKAQENGRSLRAFRAGRAGPPHAACGSGCSSLTSELAADAD